MRLCDEYSERMGLGRLFLRHSSRFFLFFDDGERLFSCKWIHNNSSCGHYEFSENILGRTVSLVRRDEAEWDEYEDFLAGWLGSHDGLVFDRLKVFDLSWMFFLKRNDRFLSSNVDPSAVYATVDKSNPLRSVAALDLVGRISSSNLEVARFWNSRSSEIISKYAHWLDGFGKS